jgi:integrase
MTQSSRHPASRLPRLPSSYHEIVHVRIAQSPGRLFPLVLLENGRPGYVINAYLNYLMMRGEQESTFRQKLQAVCQLYEFCRRKYGDAQLDEAEVRGLIFEFGSAKLHGTIQPDGSDSLNLYWRPVLPSTLRSILRYIDDFDAFQVAHFRSTALNPAETRFQTAFQRYQDFKARTQYDPFVHLFPSRSRERKEAAYAVVQHKRDSQRRRPHKVFPAEFIIEMIERTPEPRDKMLLLLMAFGGLRRSEPLHLLQHDMIGQFRDTGAAWITLADPVRGPTRWTGEDGREHAATRREFLAHEFHNGQLPVGHPLRNLQPRCLYGRHSHGLYVGFKGMTFTGHDENNFVHWLHEEAGVMFWKAHADYIQQRFHNKPAHWPYHPFLFIRVDADGFGLPLTLAAVEKIFARAAGRVGITGVGPHSLRHFYGYYLASVLKMPIEQAQACMHHASVLSTQVYYRTDPEVIRKEILVAAYKATDKAVPAHIGEQTVCRLSFPAGWRLSEDELFILRHSRHPRKR